MNSPKEHELSDEELARLARDGSLNSFDELVRRYQVPLLRFLLRRSPNRDDAEDALQESFLRAYQSLDKYRDEWPFRTWLFTLSYRLCVSMSRRNRLRTCDANDVNVASRHEGPGEQLEREESSRRLWSTARRVLSEEQFSAVWFHYVESMPAREVGHVLGRSWVWVKTTLHRSAASLPPRSNRQRRRFRASPSQFQVNHEKRESAHRSIAAELRREAKNDSPRFSPLLHERIMRRMFVGIRTIH